MSKVSTTILSQMNKRLHRLASRRASGTFSVDDAHKFLTSQNIPYAKRISYIRAFFTPANRKIVALGTSPSTRPAAKGRQVTVWRFKS